MTSPNSGVQFNGGSGQINISGSALGAQASVVNVRAISDLTTLLATLDALIPRDARAEDLAEAQAALAWLRANAQAPQAPPDAEARLGTLRRVGGMAWQVLCDVATSASSTLLAAWLTGLLGQR